MWSQRLWTFVHLHYHIHICSTSSISMLILKDTSQEINKIRLRFIREIDFARQEQEGELNILAKASKVAVMEVYWWR
jgi:hypothetical protein